MWWTHTNTDHTETGEIRKMSELTPGKKRFVKRKFGEEKPTVWIGKGGASPEIMKEIEKQLAKNKYVKCKILKTALTEQETKQITSAIAEQTRAVLVEVRGHTFILYKARDK
jgi:RNA-binding protein